MTVRHAIPGPRGRIALALGVSFVLAASLAPVGPAPRAESDGFEFALIDTGDNCTLSIGDLDRWGGLGRLQDEVRNTGRPVFCFTKDGREYIVRDPAVVDHARTVAAPMLELGKKQGKLGAKQGKIGARQGQLGALQGRAGALEARLALASLAGGDAKERAELDGMREELRDLRRQMDGIADEQRELGAVQRELGAQQAELGRQQAGVQREVISGLREIADDAIASGAARRLQD